MSNTGTRKISKLHIVRRISQLAFFLLAPGLFATIFESFGAIIMALTGNYEGDLLVPVLTVIIISAVTALFGRFFCGFICSFGAMGDFFWFLSGKAAPHKKRMPEQADAVLKAVKYVILAVIVTLVWIAGAVSIPSAASPWTVFGMYASVGSWPSPVYFISAGGALLVAIIIGSMLVERFFCRYFCPLGAILSLFSKVRMFNVVKRRDKCMSCSACTRKCSMGIPLYKTDVVTSGRCINCFACTEICPRGNAHANPVPAVASAISVAATAGLCYAGTILPVTTAAAETPAAVALQETEAAQNNTVEDTVNGIISSASQSASTAAQSATQAASSAKSTASAASTTAAAKSAGTYTDGTYTGSGTGFRGTTTVQVTVSGGKITDIEVVSNQDTAQYFSRAKSSVISSIISSQNVKVNAVSGATFSSNGIMEAVANALGVDFTNPNSTMQGGRNH